MVNLALVISELPYTVGTMLYVPSVRDIIRGSPVSMLDLTSSIIGIMKK